MISFSDIVCGTRLNTQSYTPLYSVSRVSFHSLACGLSCPLSCSCPPPTSTKLTQMPHPPKHHTRNGIGYRHPSHNTATRLTGSFGSSGSFDGVASCEEDGCGWSTPTHRSLTAEYPEYTLSSTTGCAVHSDGVSGSNDDTEEVQTARLLRACRIFGPVYNSVDPIRVALPSQIGSAS